MFIIIKEQQHNKQPTKPLMSGQLIMKQRNMNIKIKTK